MSSRRSFALRLGCLLLRPAYRAQGSGTERIPPGGALLVANHQSYADWAPLQLALDRPVRFVALAVFFRRWWSAWFLNAFGTIPIEPGKAVGSLKAVVAALGRGELVCLFPEGEISRTGRLGRLREGYRAAASRAGCPVVPVWIESLWDSRLAFFGGRLLFGHRPQSQRPIAVYFGAPRPADEASASALAIDLQSLQADAFAARLDVVQADAWKAAWAAKSRLPGPAIVSFSRNGPRAQWSRRDLLALGACVARAWHRRPALRLACLLPKGVPRLVAEVACAFLGRPLLSLEPGTPPEICEALVAEADCDAVILSSATVRNHPGLFSGNTHWLIDDAIVRAPFWQRLALRCFPGKRPPARTEAWNSVAIQALQLYRSGDASGRWFIMPGAGPGWLSTWLPLLTDATLIAAEPGENTGWLADLVRETRVDTLVASGPQVAAWLERGEALSGLSLRRILTFDFDEPPQTWEEAENRWKVPVLRAWCDPQSGWLLCLEAIDPPRPFSTSSPQCGRKKGSVGRPLPGIALRTASRSDKSSEVEETAPEAAQPLEVYAPAFGIHHWRALPARGHIDSDGFVFLAER